MLNKAEGIFYQIKEAEHLTDNIRFILGLPLLGNHSLGKLIILKLGNLSIFYSHFYF